MTKVQVKAVLFDLFDTLLLVEGGEVWYKPALRKLHKFLVSNVLELHSKVFPEYTLRLGMSFTLKARKIWKSHISMFAFQRL